MHSGQDAQRLLKEAVFEIFRNHSFKEVEFETYKRGFTGKTPKLSETAGSVPQSVYRRRGEIPPAAEYGI